MWRFLRSFLCTFVAVASASVGVSQEDAREAIRWDHVYGSKQITISDPAPRSFDWLNDAEFYKRGRDGWDVVDAVTGGSKPLFDKNLVSESLRQVVDADSLGIT